MSLVLDVPVELQREARRFLEEYDVDTRLDSEQKDLIKKGALDLILLENASELFRIILQKQGVFENILKKIAKGRAGVVESKEYNGKSSERDVKLDKVYRENMKIQKRDIQTLLLTFSKIITIVALDFGEEGGHYGAIYYDVLKRECWVFDSMQGSAGKSGSESRYTQGFITIARELTGIEPSFPLCFNQSRSLQLTGGFVDPDSATETEKQDLDSQNHFCYMWSIWFLHMLLVGDNIEDNIAKIFGRTRRDIPLIPLVVIKVYSYCIISNLKILDNIPLYLNPFFIRHWLAIWWNKDSKFRRYAIQMNDSCSDDIDCCYHTSLTPQVLVTKPNTDPTPTLRLMK